MCGRGDQRSNLIAAHRKMLRHGLLVCNYIMRPALRGSPPPSEASSCDVASYSYRDKGQYPHRMPPARSAALFRLFRPFVSLRRLWPSALARVEWESAPGIGPDLG